MTNKQRFIDCIKYCEKKFCFTWDAEFTSLVKCKPLKLESSGLYKVRADSDGTIRVYDNLCKHFTLCHSLSSKHKAKIYEAIRYGFNVKR